MTKLPQMDTPETPPPPPLAPPAMPAMSPAPKPSKLRTYVSIAVLVVILGAVVWAVKDNQSAGDLGIGQCFDVPTGSTIKTVVKHACTEAHDAEVFYVGEYSGTDTEDPGIVGWNAYIDSACLPVFETYTGESADTSADLTYGWFYPSEAGWNAGDRTFTCYANRKDEAKLAQSVKGSAT